MKRRILIIIAMVSILSLSGCWRYYHHNNGNDYHNDNNRGYHHMGNY